MPTGLNHQGFYIPNAADVSNPRMAEPDRVDFNTLAHPLWGVLEGCQVTVSGVNASSSGGTLLVNGNLVTLKSGTVGLGSGGAQDRFDLIVSDAGGNLTVQVGTPAVDPVFPDPPLDTTVLAAVFCSGGGPFNNNVIDKRKFVSKALLTKIDPSAPLVQNLNNTGNHFLLAGDGTSTWESDTWMWRSGPATLSIHKHLLVDGTLTAHGDVLVSNNVTATGDVTANNLRKMDTPPADVPAGSIQPGTIWQNTAIGRVYVWRSGAWQEMATMQSVDPVGSVINSLEVPSVMVPLGWLPLDGRTINENVYPSLFGVTGLQYAINGAVSPRTMKLPDARKRMPRFDFDLNAGSLGGPNVGNSVVLQKANMPRHGHNPKTDPAGSSAPTVTISSAGAHIHTTSGGDHIHDVTEDEHAHHGMDLGGGIASAVICTVWGGQNKIDALFNDRNHTYSVEALEWTMPAKTGVKIVAGNSAHAHIVDSSGSHVHTAQVTGIGNHTHVMTEEQQGESLAFDITPEYIVLYTYVRS